MLDDEKKIHQIDASHMLETLAKFPEQIKEAQQIAETIDIDRVMKIDNVLITGMGASAIAGDIAQSLFRNKIDVPIVVNREYDIPKWAKKDTLTIFFSYSGNTEETLGSFKIANQKKCKIICASSGGKLQEYAAKRNVPYIKIPAGYQPREATAYMLFPLIGIMKQTGLLKQTMEKEIEETISVTSDLVNENKQSVPEQHNYAKQLARTLHSTIPQIYGWGIYAPIARRWRQQFNENSKVIARADAASECNHNDIVGWSSNPEASKQFSYITFRDDTESIYMATRLDFMKTLYSDITAHAIEVFPKGKSPLAKSMYAMGLGDFVSCYLAILRNIDPTPVDAIAELKKRLAEL